MLSFFPHLYLWKEFVFLHIMLKLKMNFAEFYFLKRYDFSKLEGGNKEILKFVWTKELRKCTRKSISHKYICNFYIF